MSLFQIVCERNHAVDASGWLFDYRTDYTFWGRSKSHFHNKTKISHTTRKCNQPENEKGHSIKEISLSSDCVVQAEGDAVLLNRKTG